MTTYRTLEFTFKVAVDADEFDKLDRVIVDEIDGDTLASLMLGLSGNMTLDDLASRINATDTAKSLPFPVRMQAIGIDHSCSVGPPYSDDSLTVSDRV